MAVTMPITGVVIITAVICGIITMIGYTPMETGMHIMREADFITDCVIGPVIGPMTGPMTGATIGSITGTKIDIALDIMTSSMIGHVYWSTNRVYGRSQSRERPCHDFKTPRGMLRRLPTPQ